MNEAPSVQTESLVSIAMPVRNCQNTLHLALESMLSQSYANWELLLINDGSSDQTLAVAQQFVDPRIKLFSDGKSLGLPARLNQAIEMATGKYFARMDGDDVAYPDRLLRQVGYLEQHRDVDLVGGWVIVFGSGGAMLGKRTGPEAHSAICAKPFAGFPMAHPTYMGKTGWFRRYGYRSEAVRCEDQDLLLRSYRSSRFANVPAILLGYREESIDLQKILTARRFLAKCLLDELWKQGRPGLAIRAVAEQFAKSLVDCIAVGTRLNYRLLRHRALPYSQEDHQGWRHVWTSLNRRVLA